MHLWIICSRMRIKRQQLRIKTPMLRINRHEVRIICFKLRIKLLMGSRSNVCRYAFEADEFYLLMRDKRGVLKSFSGHPF